MSDEQLNNLRSVYDQLCTSYRAIDDFRAKLLGFLPLASGAGVFLLLGKKAAQPFLVPLGAFGFAVTLGLFMYELYGIRKCHALIIGGKQIEYALGVDGQFVLRPREIAGVINEPFAAGIIYPAVLAAWLYIGLFTELPQHASWMALFAFFAGFAGTLFYNVWLKCDQGSRPSST